ncbi:uncharacterized protein (DUF2252 family) [Bradyrhizobium sp. RT5a]
MPKLDDFFRQSASRADLAKLSQLKAGHLTRMDRIANGRALRSSVPRSSHGELFLSRSRSDPLLVLQAQNATRIKELVPVRMARMLASPFAFMRGSAAIMAGDLANSPRTNLQVMACGDMHLLNFGLFASAERNLVFAINDFDEVLPALWEWDLKRLAASAAVAAQFMAGDRVDAEHAARAVVEAYIARMRGYAEMDFLEVWYDLIDEKTILASAPPRMRKLAQNTFKKARGRGHIRALDRLTEEVNGEHRILEDVPLIVRAKHLPDGTPVTEALTSMLRSYLESLPEDRRRLLSRFRVVDVARKVVGVGSVGTNCWVVLLEEHGAGSPLFLQIKEAQESVLAQFLDGAREVKQQGRRVVVGQRMIQGSPDVFLGWGPVDASKTKRHYYVRQLADMKGGLSLAEGDRKTRDGLPDYCRLCGWALALAHAKSGDAAMISGYCGTGDVLPDAIGKYALAYLEQTERDYGVLKTAARNGKVSVAKQR